MPVLARKISEEIIIEDDIRITIVDRATECVSASPPERKSCRSTGNL
jgi:hypothetical protein